MPACISFVEVKINWFNFIFFSKMWFCSYMENSNFLGNIKKPFPMIFFLHRQFKLYTHYRVHAYRISHQFAYFQWKIAIRAFTWRFIFTRQWVVFDFILFCIPTFFFVMKNPNFMYTYRNFWCCCQLKFRIQF